nr:hypothetical protein KPHV_25170 [Kitasatospora purpeofusca]
MREESPGTVASTDSRASRSAAVGSRLSTPWGTFGRACGFRQLLSVPAELWSTYGWWRGLGMCIAAAGD